MQIAPHYPYNINMSFNRPDIIRPPSEAGSYFLPFTSGCSHNSCGFCNFYGCQLQIRNLSDIKKEIDAVAAFTHQGLQTVDQPSIVYYISNEWDGRRIFLQDGDALVYPYEELVAGLQYLNFKMPQIERIASYTTTQDILRLSVDKLKTLHDLKLGILYLGVESGDDAILKQINKGVTSQQIIEAGRMIKAAGILSSVTVLLGLGGPTRSKEHALAAANILTALDPDYAGALTLTLIPGTPMHQAFQKGEFQLISPMQSLQELQWIIQNSQFTHCFFSSMHASNYLSLRGTLPDDKEKMLHQLDFVLRSADKSLLRPEYMRGL